MAKLSDHDMSKESLQLQEFFDEVKTILNGGSYEVEFSAAAPPDYTAPNEPRLVFSKVGAQVRLYCSYLGTWYYVALTS